MKPLKMHYTFAYVNPKALLRYFIIPSANTRLIHLVTIRNKLCHEQTFNLIIECKMHNKHPEKEFLRAMLMTLLG